jgi:lipid-A-disaccharide synthase
VIKPRRKALIVTGEASGDLHGGNLLTAARRIDPELDFFGVGGPRMIEAGCDILIPGKELAVMGLVETFGHLPRILRAFKRLKKILLGPERPDLLVLIDFPEFNLKLAKQAQKAGIPVLYYVSPQVWAWRRGRVKKIARVVDRLAAIFPFEPEYYRGQDIEVEYVGNPLLDELQVSKPRVAFLQQYQLGPEKTVVGLFPGSRENELKYILGTILDSAQVIAKAKPEVQFLLPVAATLDKTMIQDRVDKVGLPITLIEENIYNIANACDAVIAVSGTVTLQTALVGTPMAIIYRLSPLSYAIGKRLIKVPHIGLANIVAGKGVVKEFIQNDAHAENVAGEILRLLEDPNYRKEVCQGLALIQARMGKKGCSERVARIASDMSHGVKPHLKQKH